MAQVLPDGRIAVMAIVNRTPDSFFDKGRTFALDAAVAAGVEAVDAGADWVDIGGLPFSPNTPLISVEEEIERVVPVVEGLLGEREVVISIDTWRVEVADAAVAAGARVINDTSGLRDRRMAELAAATGAGLVICHSIAEPHRHAPSPHYGDVVDDIVAFLRERIALAESLGVAREQIVADPGHDLNKNTRHSLEITRRFDEFVALGLPTLAAVSRKDFLAEALDLPKGELHDASVAAASWCLALGARVIRMHDVVAASRAARLAEIITGVREPLGELRHNV